MQYRIAFDYKSGTAGPWQQGQIVEVDDALADWLGRDAPGLLQPVEPERKTAKKKTRQVTKASNRGEAMHTGNMEGE